MKKFLTGFVAAVLVCALAVGALAASGKLTIEVNTDMKIKVNGEIFAPTDANGKPVPVFEYNGTTYAPLRALAEAYGLTVGYDAQERMATVDDPEATPSVEPSAAPSAEPSVVPSTEATVPEHLVKGEDGMLYYAAHPDIPALDNFITEGDGLEKFFEFHEKRDTVSYIFVDGYYYDQTPKGTPLALTQYVSYLDSLDGYTQIPAGQNIADFITPDGLYKISIYDDVVVGVDILELANPQ